MNKFLIVIFTILTSLITGKAALASSFGWCINEFKFNDQKISPLVQDKINSNKRNGNKDLEVRVTVKYEPEEPAMYIGLRSPGYETETIRRQKVILEMKEMGVKSVVVAHDLLGGIQTDHGQPIYQSEVELRVVAQPSVIEQLTDIQEVSSIRSANEIAPVSQPAAGDYAIEVHGGLEEGTRFNEILEEAQWSLGVVLKMGPAYEPETGITWYQINANQDFIAEISKIGGIKATSYVTEKPSHRYLPTLEH